MHPILDAFNGTPHEWIKKLLFTFNEGNIGKFEALAPLFPQEVSTPRSGSGSPITDISAHLKNFFGDRRAITLERVIIHCAWYV